LTTLGVTFAATSAIVAPLGSCTVACAGGGAIGTGEMEGDDCCAPALVGVVRLHELVIVA
jgi:hypothetical protein